MLQFLKKTGRRKSIAESGDIDTTPVTPAAADPTTPASLRKSNDLIDDGKQRTTENDYKALRHAERYCFEKRDSFKRASKLSRRMSDILGEQSTMCYFVQFMESRNALSFIKFWLDVESFKSAAFESGRDTLRTTGNCGHHTSAKLQRSFSTDGCDSPSSFSTDCDSLSTKSYSGNTFKDTHSTDDVREIDARTSPNCTSAPPTPQEVLEEVDIEDEVRDNVGTNQLMVIKPSEICDMTIMNQSLTDDEKTQICEAGKGASCESSTSMKPSVMHGGIKSFNSLINSDAVRIYSKYLTTNSPHYIEVPATILSAISLKLCSSGSCSEKIFNEAQLFLLELLERSYLNQFLESSFYCKYTLEVLTSENLTLRDILASEMALFYFMEHLEQQGKRHYLEFYVAASNFKRSYESKAQVQKDAVVLYEKYFSLQATCSLSLSDKVRFILEEQICSADPANIAECFELPVQIIEHFLEQRFFAGFLKSSLYCRFISELLGKVNSNTTNNVSGILPGERTYDQRGMNIRNKGHRKTLSDVTSDSSIGGKRENTVAFISSRNTLLAMCDTSSQRNSRHLVATAATTINPSTTGLSGSNANNDIMQIDSRHLYNPDLLWRRNSTVSGLTFGRVNALGRYERDFDIAEPPSGDDRWNRHRIKRAVRKLVNLPEEKAQEELAWQVAEMIVKDITSVTMNNKT